MRSSIDLLTRLNGLEFSVKDSARTTTKSDT